LVKNSNFGKKNRNSGQKLRFWSKIKFLVKNQQLKSTIEIWSITKNGDQKNTIWLKIEILVKN